MFSRRRFLHLGSLSAAATAVAGAVAPLGAKQQAPTGAPRREPASFKALSSMRAQAKPITTSERSARMARARELMHDAKLDAMVLTGGTSLSYFTNIRWGLSERFFALVLPRKGQPFGQATD